MTRWHWADDAQAPDGRRADVVSIGTAGTPGGNSTGSGNGGWWEGEARPTTGPLPVPGGVA